MHEIYDTITEIEGSKKDINDFKPNLGYMAIFGFITVISLIIILFAVLKLHEGIKL